MIAILKSIHKFDRCAERFAFRHPYLAFLVMLIGMPVFILATVAACTTASILPLALIFGWL